MNVVKVDGDRSQRLAICQMFARTGRRNFAIDEFPEPLPNAHRLIAKRVIFSGNSFNRRAYRARCAVLEKSSKCLWPFLRSLSDSHRQLELTVHGFTHPFTQ